MRYFIVCMLLISFCNYGFADPGEVNEDGGHYNQKTGEYHYHIKQEESTTRAKPWNPIPNRKIFLLFLSNQEPLRTHNGMPYR
ncbi:YHYH domain-containing protein [Candidatus Poribacteria bacterium]|nr:YHYH domain-containing protein [Candidatus Poribacteria bacterium]MYG07414.1 YHYH domain-containing protein [Candidatus Poribacteria bacterium]MYK24649.1 YHYH domain-containing protein [Candidatus Poribacteria bacterium]